MYPQIVPSWNYSTRATQKAKNGKWTGAHKDTETLMQVPCGKCPDCRKKRAMEWCHRLTEEYKNSHNGIFLTLTYNDENIPWTADRQTLDKQDGVNFMKNLRRQIDYIYKASKQPNFKKYGKHTEEYQNAYNALKGSKLKYFFIGEYGTKTHRPHYHAIMFNVPLPIQEKINKIWGKGQIKIGNVTSKSIRYVANYVMATKQDPNDRQPEYSTQSKGIGLSYVTKNKTVHLKNSEEATVRYNGFEIPMPQYYRKKIYIQEEKALLAEKAKNNYQLRMEELEQQCIKRGITLEEHTRQVNIRKQQKFAQHKKTKI